MKNFQILLFISICVVSTFLGWQSADYYYFVTNQKDSEKVLGTSDRGQDSSLYSLTSAELETIALLQPTKAPIQNIQEDFLKTQNAIAFSELDSAELQEKEIVKDRIKRYFDKYSSPLAEYVDLWVDKSWEVAKKYDLDPAYVAYMAVAISRNESGMGKKVPKECYNAWGWGITSKGRLCFENWEEGISVFLQDFTENYMYERELLRPQDIMTRYNPTSPNGSWAKSVGVYLNQLLDDNF